MLLKNIFSYASAYAKGFPSLFTKKIMLLEHSERSRIFFFKVNNEGKNKMSYSKIGGLHFIKLGRFGASFYVSKKAEPFISFLMLAYMGWFCFISLLMLVD